MEPLYIFLDLEAAYGNNYFGDIIEIAAQVDPRILEDEIFTTFVNTKQNLSYFALKISKITVNDLRNEPYFPDAFQDFVQWVSEVVEKCSEKQNKQFVPVLVAHGGFDNDFVMIQSNLDRHEMSLDILKKFQYADTYLLAKKLKCKNVCDLWKCQLSIEKMLEHFFPDKKFVGQHRALPDVKFMIKIFLESPLKQYFDEIPLANFVDRNKEYRKRNTSKIEKKKLNDNLPQNLAKATHTMTLTRLLRNGLTYSRLISLFENAQSTLDFYDKLKDIGIDRKASKAIAAHLLAMDYCCRGKTEIEDRVEVGDEEKGNAACLTEEDLFVNAAPKSVVRTDSGFASLESMDEEYRNRFYGMFVEDFMLPPETYEYQFGSFSIEEIKELDAYIEDLFDNMFCGEKVNVVDYVEMFDDPFSIDARQKSGDDGMHEKVGNDNDESVMKVGRGVGGGANQSDTGVYKGVHPKDEGVDVEEEENWEDEYLDENVEFHLPSPIKNIPIGMTMNDVSGREFVEKQPLLQYFDAFDASAVPEGGLPQLSRKQKRNQQWKNKKRVREQGNQVIDANAGTEQGRTYGKTKSGEIIVLV